MCIFIDLCYLFPNEYMFPQQDTLGPIKYLYNNSSNYTFSCWSSFIFTLYGTLDTGAAQSTRSIVNSTHLFGGLK